MPTYALRLAPEQVVGVLRTEIARTHGQPELYIDAYRDYVIDEDYKQPPGQPADGSEYDAVTSESVLNVEARLERNYWVLAVVVHQDLGLRVVDDENALLGAPLTLEEFATALQAAPASAVSVRLDASTPQAKAHFDSWWASVTGQTEAEAAGVSVLAATDPPAARPTGTAAAGAAAPAAAGPPVARPWTYLVREVVGVLPDADALEAAVDELEHAGFSPAGISVLGTERAGGRLGRAYRSVLQAEDDSDAPQAAFVSEDTRVEGEAAAVALPFMIAGMAGAAAVVASGGILAGAIAATILGGAVGGGLGGLLAQAVAQRHAKRIAAQIASGGLVLWVSVPNDAAEQQAIAVLNRIGAHDVHVHTIQRSWGPRNRPLANVQVDPFLEADLPA